MTYHLLKSSFVIYPDSLPSPNDLFSNSTLSFIITVILSQSQLLFYWAAFRIAPSRQTQLPIPIPLHQYHTMYTLCLSFHRLPVPSAVHDSVAQCVSCVSLIYSTIPDWEKLNSNLSRAGHPKLNVLNSIFSTHFLISHDYLNSHCCTEKEYWIQGNNFKAKVSRKCASLSYFIFGSIKSSQVLIAGSGFSIVVRLLLFTTLLLIHHSLIYN